MRQPDNEAALVDMLLFARRVRDRLERVVLDDFDDDEDLQAALVFYLQTIGEAASKTSQAYRASHGQIAWRQIIGMRNRLVHDYMRISLEVVWRAATDDIPPLIDALEQLLAAANADET